jgi:ABC-type transport system involved in cytochrome c biogenesis permease subunit
MRWLVIPLLLLMAAAAPAQAQVPCAMRDVLAQSLANRHGEVPVSRGLTAEGNLLEVFASTSGSWTVVITRPTNLACIHAVGHYWTAVPPPEAADTPERPAS